MYWSIRLEYHFNEKLIKNCLCNLSCKQYNIYDKHLFTTKDNRLKLFSVQVRKLYLNNKLPSCFLCAYSNNVFRTSIVRFRTDMVLEVRKGDATQITVYCCGAEWFRSLWLRVRGPLVMSEEEALRRKAASGMGYGSRTPWFSPHEGIRTAEVTFCSKVVLDLIC